MDILDAIADHVRREGGDQLEGAYLTRCVILAEVVIPSGGRAFQRIALTASGDRMVSWEIDGFLVKGLRVTQPDLPLP